MFNCYSIPEELEDEYENDEDDPEGKLGLKWLIKRR